MERFGVFCHRAKRSWIVCALALCLVLTLWAAPASAVVREEISQLALCQSSTEAIGILLDWMAQEDSPLSGGQRVGRWLLHPGGFALCIPEGYEVSGDFTGTMILLKDTRQTSGPRRTVQPTISLVVEDAGKEGLDMLNAERIERAYAGNFRRFELTGYRHEAMFGEDGIRITYKAYDGQTLRMQQRIFDKAGKRYYLTLMTPDTRTDEVRGRSCFSALCASLVFRSAPDAQ